MNCGKFFKLCHAIIFQLVLVILIRAPEHIVAQDDDVKGLEQSFNPGMSVALVCITSIFFLIALISLIILRCINTFGPSPTSLPPRRGVDPVVVITFPTFLYSHVKGPGIGQRALECAICLLKFEDNQILRLLPKRSHVFHTTCIDAWLAFHDTCPLCRANLFPKPVELITPVVPTPLDPNLTDQTSNLPPENSTVGTGVTGSVSVDLIIDVGDTNQNPNLPR